MFANNINHIDIRREFGPYAGVVYARSYVKTADYLCWMNENPGETRLATGACVWS